MSGPGARARLVALAPIAAAAVAIAVLREERWWGGHLAPLRDLGFLLLLAGPVVLVAAVGGWQLRRRDGRWAELARWILFAGQVGWTAFTALVGAFSYGRRRPRPERCLVDVAGLDVPVTSLDDLMRMKRASGRAKDRVELEVLGALRDERDSMGQ